MNKAEKLLEKLLEHVKTASKFEYAASLLEWDQETKMPPKGAEGRAEIFATVKTEGFKIFTSDEVGKILKELMREKEKLDTNKQVLVERINEVYHRAKAIPTDLFKTFNETKSKAYHVWVEAKNKSDFKIFMSSLEKILEIRRRFAELYGYEKNPYDGLLPDYEPGLTAEDLKTIVKELRQELVPFVRTLMDKTDKPNEKILEGNFPENLQHEFSLEVLKALGYDFDRGRLDTTVHPFTIGVGPDDVRVTTNYDVKKLDSALFATIHECGHALYDQGKDPLLKWVYMDAGYSHGIHESQSRMMENMVGRSFAFWKFYYPKLQSYFPSFKKVPVEEFYRAINAVKPSLIRIFADEVTYNLHIMLRFEIEEAMLKGEVKVKELPALWNEKMQEYLGITPKKDSEGVLQDVHWSMGYIGYFPSYMLGNLYAAQLFATAKREIQNLEEKIAEGKFSIFLTWLRSKVHRFGLIYEAPQLLKEVTGQGPTSKPWLEYIKEKFSKIYP